MNNIKEIIYKNIKFNKNISKGGALYKCLDELKQNYNIIHIDNKNIGRLWGQIQDDQILELLNKNIGLFEVIHKFPYKVYFDIDGDNKCNLNDIKKIINSHFIGCRMSISGYEIENKHSYHIILNNYIINNIDEREKLKIIVKYFYSLNSNFDWKVYTKNRNMKAINQSKRGKEPQKIIEDQDYKNHLITFFVNSDSKNINNILINKVEEEQFKKIINSPMDLAELPQMELILPKNFDIQENYNLLKITPIDNRFNHKYTWTVARFCYYNNISFEDFKAWHQNKCNSIASYNKWINHWNNLKYAPEMTRKDYIKFISYYYPELQKNKYSEFTQLFNYKKKNKIIKSLSQDDFNFNSKCKIINIGMGGGKTTQTINYLKSLENTIDEYGDTESFIWITPNISLAKNTFSRIKENEIECNIYDSAKNKKLKQELIENSKNIIICLNSLFYTKRNQYNSYEVVVIDEIETFLKLFNNNNTLKELDIVFKKFIEILTNCKKLILLDAFISKISLNFLDSVGIDYEIIKREKETSNRTAIIKKNFDHWMRDIINDLKENKKLLIFYPFKNPRKKQNLPSMSELCTTLEHYTKKKGIFHNADSSDNSNKKLKDVNKSWVEYDFVISNNKINVGLNFDVVNYFDTCYLSIAGFNSPRDIIQFSYRARSLKSNTIKYCFLDHFNNMECVKIEKVNEYNDIFKQLNNDIIIEKMANLKETFKFFLCKAGYNIINENIGLELQPIDFIENDFYNYDKISDQDSVEIKDSERQIYLQEATIQTKLMVKKFYYNRLFTLDTDPKILSNLWNNNKFNLIQKIKSVLYEDNIIKLLKNNYNWSCYYPDNIDNKFKFNSTDLENIFENYKFKSLTIKSKDHLILKSYINNIFGCQVVKSKSDKSKNYKFFVDDEFKDYYIKVVENIKPLKVNEKLEIIN